MRSVPALQVTFFPDRQCEGIPVAHINEPNTQSACKDIPFGNPPKSLNAGSWPDPAHGLTCEIQLYHDANRCQDGTFCCIDNDLYVLDFATSQLVCDDISDEDKPSHFEVLCN